MDGSQANFTEHLFLKRLDNCRAYTILHYSINNLRRNLRELGQVLEHKHLIVRAELNNPPKDPAAIKDWMARLVDTIGMKILMGPYSVYSPMVGNQGLTAVTIIETSHIAMHVWDECDPGLMQFDVYTCSKLDIKDVFDALSEFEPTKVEYKFIDREHGLKTITGGKRTKIKAVKKQLDKAA